MKLLPPADVPAATRFGRARAAWRAAHEPVAGVSRRVRRVACAIPLTVLPSSLWRLPAAFDRGIGFGERAYVVFLSVLSEVLAFTAFGLVARWGEVFPRWIPFLGGRRVPARAAVVPAALGAGLLTGMWTVLTVATQIAGKTIRGDDLPGDFPSEAGGWEAASFYVCYAPLTLWGPLLAVLTVAYGKRRRAAGSAVAGA
ncbi:hypothetical protein BLA24_05420 [Streptomyces cinnamoneus]|uniref:DUF3995 domain-containing protein n=1 Tax=Streptomyces cinnamoneus TaxID=53446 RepID=A0A2G1XN91_STRCJ|nr:hypothetical protein [Streptomyces cinnamoneus]PHQ52715.1 hypothetical protein BLA24_05420 [Streptomyces cinnamoneus]PPT11809.1 hypothetical protein CYQ11_01880 [Streptomyces cinnamoneus]